MTTEKPRCPYCKKPMRRDTHYVCAPREDKTGNPIPNWRYEGNLIVVKKTYVKAYLGDIIIQKDSDTGIGRELAPRQYERRLSSVSVWDGESYHRPIQGYFCSKICAARFGQEAYRRGARLP